MQVVKTYLFQLHYGFVRIFFRRVGEHYGPSQFAVYGTYHGSNGSVGFDISGVYTVVLHERDVSCKHFVLIDNCFNAVTWFFIGLCWMYSDAMVGGIGYYTGEEHKVLVCVVRRKQINTVKRIIQECDPMAFTFITKAREVKGNGFNPPQDADM